MTRIVYGLFVAVVGAFVVSNVYQVARTLFYVDTAGTSPSVAAPCGAAVDQEIVSIERARAAALGAVDPADAKVRYANARASGRAERADISAVCSADPNGIDAISAVLRLDRAAESHAVRDATEIGPVRQSARSFIRVPQK